ncbi:MAG TPA: TssQ family T6SS-associated lipoprotein [Paucimonas sp.]|nr:TssQ family T6SS-associated lipoprotein [Paucimonas sp.]
MRSIVLAVAFALAGCAQMEQKPERGKQALSYAEAQARYQQGLANYRSSNFGQALTDLTLAIDSGQLRTADLLLARKHAAFIHCSNGREHPCREHFQAILAASPSFDLAPNEASHPLWGPVWRSLKGAVEEKRAVTQASKPSASPAQQKLAEGIREYDGGLYKEALDALQAALKGGLPAKADEIRAHKYMAFAYCLTNAAKQCRAEFAHIFTLDPAFELLPSEAGHPSWAKVYRSEKAAAAKRAKSGAKNTSDSGKASTPPKK